MDLIRAAGHIGTADLVERFGISIATARRDLAQLEREGLIQRTRGGAVLEKRSLLELSYQERESRFIKRKQRIAEKALTYIKPGNRIFFNDGTTVMQLARKLAQAEIPLTVMTNSIKLADILVYNRTIDVLLIGGDIKEFSYASSGPLAELMIESLNADLAIIGADAFHPVKGVCIQPIAEAVLTKKMVANSNRVIAVGDSSKIGSMATVTVCPWKSVDVFITDKIKARDRVLIERFSVEVPIL